MNFAALLTSRIERNRESFRGCVISADISPESIEKNTINPQIDRVLSVAFLIDETRETAFADVLSSVLFATLPIPKIIPVVAADITEEK